MKYSYAASKRTALTDATCDGKSLKRGQGVADCSGGVSEQKHDVVTGV